MVPDKDLGLIISKFYQRDNTDYLVAICVDVEGRSARLVAVA